MGDLNVGSSEGMVDSFVGSDVDSFVGSLVGSVARETEDEARSTTEVLLGTALTIGVALLITSDEDEKT